ncbi:MAG: glycosyltransferase family 2 protein, partial [Pirellulales bacterium]
MSDRNARPRLSAAIIALNEQANLPELLRLLDWVDEVVVVDGGSSDRTVELARQNAHRVVTCPFDNYAAQRNRALACCTGEWVLAIDADERPTAGLVREVLGRIDDDTRYAAFRVPVRSTIFGRRVRYSGTQDDRPVRLVRRERAYWSGAVHETVRCHGRVGRLEHGLMHRTLPDPGVFLQKMESYTSLAVEQGGAPIVPRQCGRGSDAAPAVRAVCAGLAELCRRLLCKGGLLDGPPGWLFCALSGLSAGVEQFKRRGSKRGVEVLHGWLDRHGPSIERLTRPVCLPPEPRYRGGRRAAARHADVKQTGRGPIASLRPRQSCTGVTGPELER